MKWKAIQVERYGDGEARVLDVENNRIVARIIIEPFEGLQIANMIASAPDMLETLHLVNERIADLLRAVTAHEYVQRGEEQ